MMNDLSRSVSMAVATLRRMRAPESMVTLALSAERKKGAWGEPDKIKYPPPPPMFKDDATARAILRIEVYREAEYVLAEGAYRSHDTGYGDQWNKYRAGKMDGPPTFMGVAVYFVERLPAPGWRVVNPLS